MELIVKLFTIFGFILLGFILKKAYLLNDIRTRLLLKFVFYFTLPCLIFYTFTNLNINFELLMFPVYALIYLISMFLGAYLIKNYLRLDNNNQSVMISSMMIINIGFLIPFIYILFGDKGFSKLMMFDIIHGIATYTITFFIAYKLSNKRSNTFKPYKLILMNMPLLALIISLIANFYNVNISIDKQQYLYYIGWLTIPLVLISLGYFINFSDIMQKNVMIPAFAKVSIAILISYLIYLIFKPNKSDTIIIFMIMTGPAGYNVLTFAGILKTNEKYAASIISTSLMISLFISLFFILINPCNI